MAEQDDAMIAQMAAQQLGPAPAPDGQPAPVPAGPPQPAPPVDTPPTDMEKVQEIAGPQTEGDNLHEESFINVDMGDGRKQTFSASQIAGMSNRYKTLNHDNATRIKPIQPAINMIESVMANAKAAGHNVSGDDMAQFLQASMEAYTKNPTLGDQRDVTPDRPDGNSAAMEVDDEIAQWERDNSVELPPMYRQGMQLIQQLQEENGQMKGMMQDMMSRANGINQEAKSALDEAGQQSNSAYKMKAATNLNQMQQALNLPDEAQDDFFNFAYGRGYNEDDFIDPELTYKIGQDFAANRNAPEMERLRAMNERRQAFTGSVNPMPSGGGAVASAPSADQGFMDALTAQAMQKRGLA
jgi:hypothetical protein